MTNTNGPPVSGERSANNIYASIVAPRESLGNRSGSSHYQDLTGEVFGRLTCIRDVGRNSYCNVLWLCKCSCGNEVVVRGHNLKTGHTSSCGCLPRELLRERRRTHGLSKDEDGNTPRLCTIWNGMKKRCLNPNHKFYHCYGGRGITVCDEWRTNHQAFHDWAMANGYREDLTIDRIDNDGNYEPGNCRWATHQMQHRNMSTNRLITHDGETKSLAEWSKLLGINYDGTYARLRRGWSPEKALTAPVMRHEDKEAVSHV